MHKQLRKVFVQIGFVGVDVLRVDLLPLNVETFPLVVSKFEHILLRFHTLTYRATSRLTGGQLSSSKMSPECGPPNDLAVSS